MSSAPASAPDQALPSAREHLTVLLRRSARRLAVDLRALEDPAPAVPTLAPDALAALHAVAALARRMRARAVDAAPTAHSFRVALDVADVAPPLPVGNTRAHALVAAAFGTPLHLERARFVSLHQAAPAGRADTGAIELARAYLARIRALESECYVDRDPEGVHQLRVGVRRTRVVLRLLERLGADPGVGTVVSTLRALGDVAGALRDLDVVREIFNALPVPVPALDAANAHLARRRRVALQRLRRVLVSARHAAAMNRADEALAGLAPVALESTLEDASRSFFDRELARLKKRLAGDFAHPDGYHDVRRQSRRVRDAAEVLGASLRKTQRGWRGRLQPLQGLLGQLNDTFVAVAALPTGNEAVRPIRDALVQRRIETMAELGPPLAMLAIELYRR